MNPGADKELTRKFFLSAAQCNAQKELSPEMLVRLIIEVATEHAARLGVGYSRLAEDRNLWVLSRLTFELRRYPRMHEHFAITTWIEGFNRHFSERNFELTGEGGEVLGYARTVWMAINIDTRRPADLGAFVSLAATVSDRPCPIARQEKIHPAEETQIENQYTFKVTDIDFNRHVNSARYVELIINQTNLSTFDDYLLSRFEIAFRNEARYDDTVTVASGFMSEAMVTSITLGDKEICLSRSFMEKREDKQFTYESLPELAN